MRKPKQKRSAEALEKVIEAAEQILRTRSDKDFTIARIDSTSTSETTSKSAATVSKRLLRNRSWRIDSSPET